MSYTGNAQAREDNWLASLVFLFVAIVLEIGSHSVAQAILSCFSLQSAGMTGVYHSTRKCSKGCDWKDGGRGWEKQIRFYLDYYQLLANVCHIHRGTSHFVITCQQLSVVNLFG